MKKLCQWIATCGSIGFFSKMPGTWGSVLGVGIVVFCFWFNISMMWVFLSLLVLGWGATHFYVCDKANHDPQEVVIDEVLGVIVTFLFINIHVWTVALGFALFRGFDITKVFPINKAEKLPGAYGIIADDMIAGVFANLILRLIIAII